MVCIMTVFETLLVVGGCMAGISQHGAVVPRSAPPGVWRGNGHRILRHPHQGRFATPLAQAALIVLASVVMALTIVLLPDNEATRGGAITRILHIVPVGG